MIDEFQCPFKRGFFCMFIVAEIHPFIDGNGRIARMIMNSEFIRIGIERDDKESNIRHIIFTCLSNKHW